ncbi:hypothetical protein Kpol_1039p62 [Vanderwaltozyma polyspora DSM 70294]|uniref:Uncharacterized protein n=1 Tax=Vanderwaltozyma polyspora (strain ATCC 22028 / DSM 70294 / BCRC 21397 / CBS 2163 / NBRC 10782 / NRRL Y-8283 / UCD 57-17) TaxID=436907 RepID=A7THI7_VANPO|nr:uncharacterized protein Kpol_1039p62 [Vanderwaltozyma polyspora DSM 70294]EDO18311.1 hypothetical protein Kpol_1039p62 [Vanderwaltozyma polyspora DSM 70294]
MTTASQNSLPMLSQQHSLDSVSDTNHSQMHNHHHHTHHHGGGGAFSWLSHLFYSKKISGGPDASKDKTIVNNNINTDKDIQSYNKHHPHHQVHLHPNQQQQQQKQPAPPQLSQNDIQQLDKFWSDTRNFNADMFDDSSDEE